MMLFDHRQRASKRWFEGCRTTPRGLKPVLKFDVLLVIADRRTVFRRRARILTRCPDRAFGAKQKGERGLVSKVRRIALLHPVKRLSQDTCLSAL